MPTEEGRVKYDSVFSGTYRKKGVCLKDKKFSEYLI
jgi:hypothetical protein